ncbi:MAG: phosphate acetyltransferase [Candidatus Stygibacter australis]|nr:phosphate acetyltransferase [Candidatus Stygibacter australis]MDP8321460.1 phosphate acetyltransferase [Candidatus Stygibacter australis]
MEILKEFREKAKAIGGRVILPESHDVRILKAAQEITKQGLAEIVLVGKPDEIRTYAKLEGLDVSGIEIVDPGSYHEIEAFADYYYAKRKKKGISYDEALMTVTKPLYFGAMMVKFGKVDGMVAGAANTTGSVIKAGLRVVGITPGLNTVSSALIMVVPDFQGKESIFLFSDCAVVPVPTAEQLADIAIETAHTGRQLLGMDPKVTLLSFSTLGSAEHERVNKVRRAKKLLEDRNVDFDFDGELQLDAAIVPMVAERKAPDSPVAGRSNILIFPEIQSGNIGCKLVEHFAKAQMIGPIIQGLAAPICDLSRGCEWEDVVNTTALVILLAQNQGEEK